MAEERGLMIVERDEVAVLMHRLDVIRDIRATVMKEGVHFGTIPGTDTPALWQAGGDILKVTFKLRAIPRVELDPDIQFPHRGYVINTDIVHLQTQEVWATGYGSCSTMEKKYRWRWAARKCPVCGKESIRKGAEQYGGGFFCNKKEEGCGARFKEDDEKIASQEVGRTENADLADLYNTVLKIAKKRSFIDGILDATGAREQFIPPPEEDDDEDEKPRVRPQQKPQAKPAQKQQPQQKQPEAFKFQPDTLYVGTVVDILPVDGVKAGLLSINTEHGLLTCRFRVTPESIVNVKDWKPLVGKQCSLSFLVKEGDSGTTYQIVDNFEILLEEGDAT